MSVRVRSDFYFNCLFALVAIGVLFFGFRFLIGFQNSFIDSKIMNLTQRVSFGSSDPEAIKKHLNALKRHKNRIEKALETKRALSSFSVKNCEEIEKMAFTCGNLLLKMGKKSSSKINISRIKAADLAAWQLAFETVKLKSIIWDGKGNKTKVYSQLSKVEASSGKLEVHLNALLASL